MTARRLVAIVRYQYHNDPLFKMRIDKSDTVNLDSFTIQLILNSNLKRDYLVQHRMWKRKMIGMMKQAKKLMKQMNAEKANADKA